MNRFLPLIDKSIIERFFFYWAILSATIPQAILSLFHNMSFSPMQLRYYIKLLLFLSCLAMVHGAGAAPVVTRSVKGTVAIKMPGASDWATLKKGQPLPPGAEFKAEEGSYMILRDPRGLTLTLLGPAAVQYAEDGGHFAILSGYVYFEYDSKNAPYLSTLNSLFYPSCPKTSGLITYKSRAPQSTVGLFTGCGNIDNAAGESPTAMNEIDLGLVSDAIVRVYTHKQLDEDKSILTDEERAPIWQALLTTATIFNENPSLFMIDIETAWLKAARAWGNQPIDLILESFNRIFGKETADAMGLGISEYQPASDTTSPSRTP